MRALLAAAALLVACSGAAPEPPTVVIAAEPAPSTAPEPGAPPEPMAPPPAADAEEAMRLINQHLQASGPGHTSAGMEAGGRIVKRDADDAYEEEFFLKDVAKIVYVHEPDWKVPHVARVMIKPSGVTRFHRGDEPWVESTIPSVSFAVSNRPAADAILEALRSLVRR